MHNKRVEWLDGSGGGDLDSDAFDQSSFADELNCQERIKVGARLGHKRQRIRDRSAEDASHNE